MSIRRSYTKSGYQKFAGVSSIRSTYNDGTVLVGHKIAKVQPKGDYARTLIDPFGVSGVRIPDLSCYPTATYRCEKQLSWVPQYSTTTDSSTAMVIDLCPEPQYQLLNGPESTIPGVRRAANPPQTAVPNYIGDLSTGLQTRFDRARLVSAAVIVRYSGNDTECQGSIAIVNECGSVLDANLNIANNVTAGTVSDPTQQKVFYKGPLKNGAIAVYRPLDSAAFAMKKTDSTTCFGQFVISITGTAKTAANLTPQLDVHIVANYEAVVKDNTQGIDEEAFAMDTEATEYGLSAATVYPSCYAGTLADIAKMSASANALGKAVKKPNNPMPKTPKKKVTTLRVKAPNLRSLANRFKSRK